MLRYLLRPFAYLRITESGRTLILMNWLLPLLLAAIATIGIWCVAPAVNFYKTDGLFSKVLGFVQSLPGFYIAALAAVATFSQEALDKPMAGQAPKARIVYNGKLIEVDLTRRRFLCLMFSYLTAVSFVLTLALVFSTSLAASLREGVCGNPWYIALARWGGASVLLFVTAQMVTVTFYGLFYLGERMHTDDL